MPPAIMPIVMAAGTVYAANKASKSAKQANSTANRAIDASLMPRSTNYGSSVNPDEGTSLIDPRIRELRERSLGRIPSYRGMVSNASGLVQDRLEGTRAELASNENPFIQARVNPLMARAAESRGLLTRSMTRRGLGGSNLMSSSLGNYDAITGREIGDQRAVATNDALANRLGLDTQIYNSALSSLEALQGLDAQEQSIAAQNLAQELAALGFSQADTAAILGAARLQLEGAQLKNDYYGRGIDAVSRLIPLLGSGSTASTSQLGGI